MIKKIDHVVITTRNLDACFSFYRKLGWTCQSTDGRHAILAGDFKINVHILGQELLPHAGHVQPGSADMCFELDGDLHAYKEKLIENGLAIELGIVSRNGVLGAMDSIYLRDPDENLIEICSYSAPY